MKLEKNFYSVSRMASLRCTLCTTLSLCCNGIDLPVRITPMATALWLHQTSVNHTPENSRNQLLSTRWYCSQGQFQSLSKFEARHNLTHTKSRQFCFFSGDREKFTLINQCRLPTFDEYYCLLIGQRSRSLAPERTKSWHHTVSHFIFKSWNKLLI